MDLSIYRHHFLKQRCPIDIPTREDRLRIPRDGEQNSRAMFVRQVNATAEIVSRVARHDANQRFSQNSEMFGARECLRVAVCFRFRHSSDARAN
jgi:hypothetical protein